MCGNAAQAAEKWRKFVAESELLWPCPPGAGGARQMIHGRNTGIAMRLVFSGGILPVAVLALALSGCVPQTSQNLSRQQIEANARLVNSSSFYSMAQIA